MVADTKLDRARVIRVRAYVGGRVRDVKRTFRVAAEQAQQARKVA
jgi:hypothetical protein